MKANPDNLCALQLVSFDTADSQPGTVAIWWLLITRCLGCPNCSADLGHLGGPLAVKNELSIEFTELFPPRRSYLASSETAALSPRSSIFIHSLRHARAPFSSTKPLCINSGLRGLITRRTVKPDIDIAEKVEEEEEEEKLAPSRRAARSCLSSWSLAGTYYELGTRRSYCSCVHLYVEQRVSSMCQSA